MRRGGVYLLSQLALDGARIERLEHGPQLRILCELEIQTGVKAGDQVESLRDFLLVRGSPAASAPPQLTDLGFALCVMRTKIARKIASSETIVVSMPKGIDRTAAFPAKGELITIHVRNARTCASRNHVELATLIIRSATISILLRLAECSLDCPEAVLSPTLRRVRRSPAVGVPGKVGPGPFSSVLMIAVDAKF